MIDVDECMAVDCGVDGECTNTLGSFTCDCDPGYVANKSNICVGRCDLARQCFLCFPVKNNLETSNVLRYSKWVAQKTFCVKPRDNQVPLTGWRLIALSLSAPPCLVPRPHYSPRPKRFGSRGPIENVVFPDRSPRIRHRNDLTERNWENAVQGLGQGSSLCKCQWQLLKEITWRDRPEGPWTPYDFYTT